MSTDKQKTYDHQTATFLALVGQCIPSLRTEEMQDWIENPRRLKRMLAHALSKPDFDYPDYLVDDPKAGWDSNINGIDLPDNVVRCSGANPIADYKIELTLGIEFEPDRGEGRQLLLRPWLLLVHKDMHSASDEEDFHLKSLDCLRNHKQMELSYEWKHLLPMLEIQNLSLSEHLYMLGVDYTESVIEHLKSYEMRITVEEHIDNKWVLLLTLLKDGLARITFRFSLGKTVLAQALKRVEEARTEGDAAPTVP